MVRDPVIVIIWVCYVWYSVVIVVIVYIIWEAIPICVSGGSAGRSTGPTGVATRGLAWLHIYRP